MQLPYHSEAAVNVLAYIEFTVPSRQIDGIARGEVCIRRDSGRMNRTAYQP